MPARPKDEVICRYAAQVGKVPFALPPTPEHAERCSNRKSFPWVSQKPDGAWVVKVSWNGQSWGLGRFSEPVAATRFADMAIRRFWKYRIYSGVPLTDNHLTHGIASSVADEAASASHSIYLDAIESRLLTIGVLKQPTTTSNDRQQQQPTATSTTQPA